jgi:hypothetical protein
VYHSRTMKAPSTECPLERNIPPRGIPWRRWILNFFYFSTFAVVGALCLMWALGFRYNRVAGSIEQTGLLQLSSPQGGLNPQVYINGQLQTETLPFTQRWVFPGHYDVKVSKEGYQTWEKQVEIFENQRATFTEIILIYEAPRPTAAPALRIDELVNRRLDNNGIEVRAGNELWVQDMFITRTSTDILNPEWYLDDTHVIYQSGPYLVLRDLTANTTQNVAFLTTEKPVPYVVRENGRVLVYAEGETLQAVELYQSISFIDRFSGGSR